MRLKTGFQLEQHVSISNTSSTRRRELHVHCAARRRRSPSGRSRMLYQSRTKADLGLYAQDRWTIKRLTLNYGVRFDYFNGYVPATQLAAGRFVGARDFAPVYGVPRWIGREPAARRVL